MASRGLRDDRSLGERVRVLSTEQLASLLDHTTTLLIDASRAGLWDGQVLDCLDFQQALALELDRR
jgi:hypothetical protein